MRTCPICGEPLSKQSAQDAMGELRDWYCPTEIKLDSGYPINHYREFAYEGHIDMHVPPYRIRTKDGSSKIGKITRYKTCRRVKTDNGRFHFKTILQCPEIHPDTEEKLKDRIKLLLIVS